MEESEFSYTADGSIKLKLSGSFFNTYFYLFCCSNS